MIRAREDAVKAWRAAGNRTVKSLLDAVGERWRSTQAAAFPYQGSSFREMFNRWRKGDSDFSEHLALQKIVAEVLDVDHGVLFPPKVAPALERRMMGFEALGAIDPRAEEPCLAPTLALLIGGRASRQHDAPTESMFAKRLRRGRHWVVAPPGAGRSLAALAREPLASHVDADADLVAFASELIGRSMVPTRVIRVTSLDELASASVRRGDVPLVVRVERPGIDDAASMRRLGHLDDVLVLAPAFPGQGDSETSDSFRERIDGWCGWWWRPGRPWRREFVTWVAARIAARTAGGHLHGAPLDVEGALSWLDDVDPKVILYATPGDLLGVLALAHERGVENLPDRIDVGFARAHLGRLAARPGTDARARWLREEGADACLDLLRAAWRDPRLSWPPILNVAEATPLLTASSSLPSFDDRLAEVADLSAELRRSRNEKRRAAIHSQIESLLKSIQRPEEAVLALMDATVMHPAGDQAWTPGPPWVQELAALDALRHDLIHEPTSRWGRLAADENRQGLVDRALAAMSSRQFFELVHRALLEFREDVLGSVTAIETLFIAASYRFAAARPVAERGRLLHDLWCTQRRMLVRAPGGTLPAPRTRGGPNESMRGGARWWAACWSWSLDSGVTTDRESLPVAFEWIFPGWFNEIGEAPSDLRWIGFSHHSDHPDEREGVARLVSLAPRVITRWHGPSGAMNDNLPEVIAAAAVVTAPQKQWPMAAIATQLLRRDDELTDRVANALTQVLAETRETVIAALWDVALESPFVTDALWPATSEERRQRSDPRGLGALMRASFPVAAVRRRVSTGVWFGEASCRALFRATPAVNLNSLAREMVLDPALCKDVIEVLAEQPGGFVDLIAEIAPKVPMLDGRRLAKRLWEIAPEQAEALAEAAWSERGEVEPWLTDLPASQILRGASIFLRHSDRAVPDDYLRWLARAIPRLGPDAERVFVVIQQQGWDRLAFAPSGLPPRSSVER